MISKPSVLVLLTSGVALTLAACGGTCEEEGTCATPATSTSTGDTSSPDSTATSSSNSQTSATTTDVTGPAFEVLIEPSKMAEEELYAADDRYNLALGPTQVADMICDPNDFEALNQQVQSDAGDDAATATTNDPPAAEAGTAIDAGFVVADAAATTDETEVTGSTDAGTDAGVQAGVCATLASIAGVVTNQGHYPDTDEIEGYTFGDSCLRVDVPFTAIGDFFEFQWIQSFNVTGYDLYVPVKLISVEGEPDETCRVGMKFYAKTGDDWVYGSAGWTSSEPYENTGIGKWELLHIDTENPEDLDSGKTYEPAKVKSIGVGFDAACDAADEDTVPPQTYSFCVGEVVKARRK